MSGIGDTFTLDTVIQAGENQANVFLTNLENIFSHPRAEIIDFCEKLDESQLLVIRADLHEKLKEILPAYSSSSLYARRRKKNLCEDVFTTGYCVRNRLEDRFLRKCVKTDSNDKLYQEVEEPVAEAVQEGDDVMQMYLTLQTTVNRLSHKLNVLTTRVGVLEDELSSAYVTIEILRKPESPKTLPLTRLNNLPRDSGTDGQQDQTLQNGHRPNQILPDPDATNSFRLSIDPVSISVKKSELDLLQQCLLSDSATQSFYRYLFSVWNNGERKLLSNTLLYRVLSYCDIKHINFTKYISNDVYKKCIKGSISAAYNDIVPGTNGLVDSLRNLFSNYNSDSRTITSLLTKSF